MLITPIIFTTFFKSGRENHSKKVIPKAPKVLPKAPKVLLKAPIFFRVVKWYLIVLLAVESILLICNILNLQWTPCLVFEKNIYSILLAQSSCLLYGTVNNGYLKEEYTFFQFYGTMNFAHSICLAILLATFSSIHSFAQKKDWTTTQWIVSFIMVVFFISILGSPLAFGLFYIKANNTVLITLIVVLNDFYFIIKTFLWLWFVRKIIAVNLVKT